MIINPTALRTLFTAFSAAFQGGFTGVTPKYSRIAQVVPSTTSANEYGWLGQIPRIREWLGDRVIQSIGTHDYTIKNRTFESTIGVLRDHIEDDNIGIYTPLMAEFGRTAAQFPDELVWPLMKAGFATPCYDGQFFFDTDHPVLDENGRPYSYSNTQGGAGLPWFLVDASRAIKPIIWQSRRAFGLTRMDKDDDANVFTKREYQYGVDGRCNAGFGFWQLAHGSKQELNADSYEAARVALGSQKADFGRPLGVNGTLLIVPPALEGAALEILNAERNAAGATNVWRGTAELLKVEWLA